MNKRINLEGIISTNAYVKLPSRLKWQKRMAVRIINHFMSNVSISNSIDLSHCSKNNYNIKKILDDPLMSPLMTIN